MMIVIQLSLSGLATGLVYGLLGAGFALIYRATKFLDFTYGAVVAIGAYAAFVFHRWVDLSIVSASGLAAIVAMIVGGAVWLILFKRLRARAASPMVCLLASLGIYVVIQNVISLTFGDESRALRTWAIEEGYNIFGGRLTGVQVFNAAVSAALLVGAGAFLRFSPFGQRILAVADDEELATCSGIDTDKVILFAVAMGACLGGTAGVLIALDTDLVPTMGFHALLMGFVACVIGGMGSIRGAAFGGIILGLAQHLGVWKVSSQWQDAIAFGMMAVFILLRPQGLFGFRVRRATV